MTWLFIACAVPQFVSEQPGALGIGIVFRLLEVIFEDWC